MTVKEFLDDIDNGLTHFDRDGGDAIVYKVGRDYLTPSSAAIDQTNAVAVYNRLAAVDIDHVCKDDSGDVTVMLYSDHNTFSDAAKECVQIQSELDDYAILDEDLYSARRDEYVTETLHMHVDRARELIEAGDAKAIEQASEITIDAKALISSPLRESAIGELAVALAETDFIG